MKISWKEFHWEIGVFLIVYHLILLIGLPIYFFFYTPSVPLILLSIVLFFFTGISITAGYHRYYAHRSYRANTAVEFFLLFFATLAAQGSALRWAFDHRLHHAYVDTDRDPYSIKKGFWYAHCLWLFKRPVKIDTKTVSDLCKNRLVMFQHRFYPLLVTLVNGGIFLVCGWLLNDYMGAFFIALWFRLFALHHCTWFINSLAHTWGDRPFSQEQSAVNNYILSFLTFGEGYHNYHHTYANDYRNGVRWYHFDPTKWLIWTLSKFGFTQDLKRMDWLTIKKRMVIEHKSLLMEKLSLLWNEQKDELSEKVNELSDSLLEQIASLHNLTAKYYELKSQCESKEMLKKMNQEYRQIKRNLKQNWRTWSRLSKNIMRQRHTPLPVH